MAGFKVVVGRRRERGEVGALDPNAHTGTRVRFDAFIPAPCGYGNDEQRCEVVQICWHAPSAQGCHKITQRSVGVGVAFLGKHEAGVEHVE